MPNKIWQRRAPALILLTAAGVMAVITLLQIGNSQSVGSAATVRQAISNDGPSIPEAADATSVGTQVIKPGNVDRDQTAHEEGPVSIQDRQTQLLSDLGGLERKFLAESKSTTWSSNTQKVITAAFSGANLAAKGAPTPASYDSECRSSTCRIRVTYSNEMDAQMGEVFLLGDIANQLPSADFGRLTSPDGAVQIVMYANTEGAKKYR